MEKSGLDPKITICKIAVLPIKLYPLKLFNFMSFSYKYIYLLIYIKTKLSEKRLERLRYYINKS